MNDVFIHDCVDGTDFTVLVAAECSRIKVKNKTPKQNGEKIIAPWQAQRGNARERCGWSLLPRTTPPCPPGPQSPRFASQSLRRTAAPSWNQQRRGHRWHLSWKKKSAADQTHEKTRRLTAAAAWFCGTGHRVGIPGIPLPPCPEPTAGTAACCGTLAGCPGCGWSVALRRKMLINNLSSVLSA